MNLLRTLPRKSGSARSHRSPRVLSAFLGMAALVLSLVAVPTPASASSLAPMAPLDPAATVADSSLWAIAWLDDTDPHRATGIEFQAKLERTDAAAVEGSCTVTVTEQLHRCKIAGLTNDTSYFLRARTVNATGASGWVWASFFWANADTTMFTPNSGRAIFNTDWECTEQGMGFETHPCHTNESPSQTVTMYGQNLQACTAVVFAQPGWGTQIPVTPAADGTSMTFDVPVGATGWANFFTCGLEPSAFLNRDVRPNSMYYAHTPQWSQSSGSTTGGQIVTLTTGEQTFVNVSNVTLGGVSASFQVLSARTMKLTIPAGSVGSVDLTFTNLAGTGTQTNAWTYTVPPTYTVSADKTPSAGGTVSASDGDSNGTWDLTATANSGYSFTSWSCTASQTPASTTSATTTVTPTANTTCTATFTADVVSYTVSADKTPSAGGTVSATDGDSDGTWDLTATPASGYAFTSWACDASQTPASTSSATTTVTPTANTTCTATFTAYTVSAARTPLAGGTVSASDANSDGTWDLTATANSGYSFTNWSCTASQTPASTSSANTTVTPTANTTCTATFTADSGSTPSTVTYTGSTLVLAGGSVTFSATVSPAECGSISSFTVAPNPSTGTGSATFSAGTYSTSGWADAAYTVTANYDGNASCAAGSDTTGTLVVASAGDAGYGGGWTTHASYGKSNFGFVVQANKKAASGYRGELVWNLKGQWRFKGTLDSYGTTTANGVNTGVSTGTGNLYWWNPALNSGLGGWALAASNVSVTWTFQATTTTNKSSTPGAYAIKFGAFTAPAGSNTSALSAVANVTNLKGGTIKFK